MKRRSAIRKWKKHQHHSEINLRNTYTKYFLSSIMDLWLWWMAFFSVLINESITMLYEIRILTIHDVVDTFVFVSFSFFQPKMLQYWSDYFIIECDKILLWILYQSKLRGGYSSNWLVVFVFIRFFSCSSFAAVLFFLFFLRGHHIKYWKFNLSQQQPKWIYLI